MFSRVHAIRSQRRRIGKYMRRRCFSRSLASMSTASPPARRSDLRRAARPGRPACGLVPARAGSPASDPTTPAARSTPCSATTIRPSPSEERRLSSTLEQNETIDGRWRYIEHTATRTRVFIRLQRQMFAVPEEIRITGVIYLPWRPGDPITSQLLRELPTARIEAAINQRLFADDARQHDHRRARSQLPSGRKVAERDLLKPLGDPKQTPDFYELVALQHGRLTARATGTPQRPWPRSAASHSAPPKAGSRRPAPAVSSHPGGGGAPDNEPDRSAAAHRAASLPLPGTRGQLLSIAPDGLAESPGPKLTGYSRSMQRLPCGVTVAVVSRRRRGGAWRGRAVRGSGAVRGAGGRARRGNRRASGTGGGARRAGRSRRSPR